MTDDLTKDLEAQRHGWQSIDTYVMPTEQQIWDGVPPVLVDNGERVGEAELKQDYSAMDDDYNSIFALEWAWTHHSTCSCCHSPMNPQPKWWQPLPPPAEPRSE